MPLYRDAAIVLRTQKLGEADRIITVLARERGLVRAVAKGVRRTRSRFGARLEPGMVVDAQLHEGRSLDTFTQVEVLAPYGEHIATSYESWTALAVMFEAAERFAAENSSTRAQFGLLAGALASLAGREHDCELIVDAFLLRSLAIAGWAPSLHDCARCGQAGPHRAFNVMAGGCLCPGCRVAGCAAPAPQTLELLGALMAGQWERTDDVRHTHRREASGLVSAYVQWHLERGLRSLPFMERSTT